MSGSCVKCGGEVDMRNYGVDGDGGHICSKCFPFRKGESNNNWGNQF